VERLGRKFVQVEDDIDICLLVCCAVICLTCGAAAFVTPGCLPVNSMPCVPTNTATRHLDSSPQFEVARKANSPNLESR
jgi:hypothetical protein